MYVCGETAGYGDFIDTSGFLSDCPGFCAPTLLLNYRNQFRLFNPRLNVSDTFFKVNAINLVKP